MKTYMPLNGLRWSRNSGSANCDMPQSVVFGRPGGFLSVECWFVFLLLNKIKLMTNSFYRWKVV